MGTLRFDALSIGGSQMNRSRLVTPLVVALLAVGSHPLKADVKTEEKTRVQFAGVLGGIALPVTLAYPCFMWVAIKKPRKGTATWNVNWALGILGMSISFVLIVGNLWGLVEKGLRVKFFKPADVQ